MITTAWKVVTADRRPGWVGGPAGMYDKGKIVKAPERSLGIFCFSEEDVAKHWANEWAYCRGIPMAMVKIQGFGCGYQPEYIINVDPGVSADRILSSWLKSQGPRITNPMQRSICFKTIKVLE
jgi:hypothetical protein